MSNPEADRASDHAKAPFAAGGRGFIIPTPPAPAPPRRMPVPRPIRPSATLAAAVIAAGVAGCAQPKAVPFDPERLREVELAADDPTVLRRQDVNAPSPRRSGRLDVRRAVDAAERRAGRPDIGEADVEAGPVPMPLREAVRRATLNNYDVAVAAFAPAVEETRVVEAEARFDPAFRQQFEFQYSDRQISNTTFGTFADQNPLVSDLTRNYTSTTSLVQQLQGGGEASLNYQATYLDSPTAGLLRGQLLDSSFESDLNLRFSQPLLRDSGRDVNRVRIVINRNSQRQAVLEFREQLEETLLEVERAYWELYRATREVEIQRDLLALTVETADRIRDRLDQDAEPLQVAQAVVAVADREAALIQAESDVRQLSDRLKLLMNDPAYPVAGAATIVPTTGPVLAPLLFDLADAAETATIYRTDIARQLLQVERADDVLLVGRNQVLPQLDVVLSGGFQGLDDSYGGSVENQFGFDNFSAAAGFQFEIPLGNREARSILKRALIQREQAIVQYAALLAQIEFEVKQAGRTLSTAYAILSTRSRSREAAQEQVRAIRAKEANNEPLTPQFSDLKLRFLSSLAAARVAEAQAVAQYNSAIAAYERARGTLLRYNNVTLAEAGAAAGSQSTRGRVPPGRALYPARVEGR